MLEVTAEMNNEGNAFKTSLMAGFEELHEVQKMLYAACFVHFLSIASDGGRYR